ncbi:hypothetical protein PIB30_068078 [Stylosanthes scabra]|uniref:Uncharacterized protein n=1 Tax=Stylosanthes scabra TaxID=79078 RepID=A0ABU6QNB8_9FABA|nr:hypothetical protein [Stylosanthes scabra]
MKQEKMMAAGLIKTTKIHVERQGNCKKKVYQKAKKTSSSSSESEYIESSHNSEFGSDETFSLPGSDSEQTMSDNMVRVERRTRSTKDSISELMYPTQEAIDISSSSEDEHEPQPNPIKVVVPKIE